MVVSLTLSLLLYREKRKGRLEEIDPVRVVYNAQAGAHIGVQEGMELIELSGEIPMIMAEVGASCSAEGGQFIASDSENIIIYETVDKE